MRKDMHKLLCEDGRLNAGGAQQQKRSHRRRLNRQLDPDSHPKQESMSGRRNYDDYKSLNENLNPLARFLESRVGQPWDKVYSEIREGLNLNSAVQLHIMEHLWQYVNRDIKLADCGTLVEAHRSVPYSHLDAEGLRRWKERDRYYSQFRVNGRKGWKPLTRSSNRYYWGRFFIHPKTGVLADTADKRLPEVKAFGRSTYKKTTHKEDGRHFVKEKGIWYELEVVPLPKGAKWGQRGPITSRRAIEPRMYRGKEIVPARENLEYGPKDHFFGPIGGKETVGGRWSVGHVRPDLNQVKAHYGSLKVYCPVGAKRRQLGSKELRRLGLENGDS